MLPLHESLTSEAQNQIMRRVRDDILLPQSNVNRTMQHDEEGTNIDDTHAAHQVRNMNRKHQLRMAESNICWTR